eukprot:2592362-Pleurochrysis_carterae.AAC.1
MSVWVDGDAAALVKAVGEMAAGEGVMLKVRERDTHTRRRGEGVLGFGGFRHPTPFDGTRPASVLAERNATSVAGSPPRRQRSANTYRCAPTRRHARARARTHARARTRAHVRAHPHTLARARVQARALTVDRADSVSRECSFRQSRERVSRRLAPSRAVSRRLAPSRT